eukprot:15431108-Heterocapsa_arctica.AAC.1
MESPLILTNVMDKWGGSGPYGTAREDLEDHLLRLLHYPVRAPGLRLRRELYEAATPAHGDQ